MAGFLVVASQVWTGDTLQWLFVAGGGVAIVLALADTVRPNATQRALDGLIALVGAWTIVEAFVFEGNNLEWWSFASAAALALLAAVGLGVHEMSTERVVHELSVSAGHDGREPAPISWIDPGRPRPTRSPRPAPRPPGPAWAGRFRFSPLSGT